MADIILHHYETSPYSEKVRLGLGLKGLAWGSVAIPVIMPKLDLTALTGGSRHADTEKTVDELRARIRKTVAFAESVSEAQYDSAADRKVSWGGKIIGGDDYLLQISLPNIYFHLTTAYAILRHNGVDIGKKDFLGPIRWVDS